MHWRRSLADKPLLSELETFLLQAFWQGTLVMTLTGVPQAQPLDPRVRVLDLCRHVPQNVGLIVVDRHENLPAETTIEHIDGSLTFDARQQIVWPRDIAQQTPALLAAACAVLSKSAWDDYHKLVEPVLDPLKIERAAFGAFCTEEGFPLPLFWFRADRRPPTACRSPAAWRLLRPRPRSCNAFSWPMPRGSRRAPSPGR